MIDIIFTGGTIGSAVDSNSGAVGVDRKNPYRLIELYERTFDEKLDDLRISEPYRILSENLNGECLSKLIEAVGRIVVQNKGVETDNPAGEETRGIIITHGTDTLIYSAAMLSILFAEADIPIILVSSNYILDDERSNGIENFFFALRYIREGRTPGVYVCYRNNGGCPVIHEGHRLLLHQTFTDSVYSVNNEWAGRYLTDSDDAAEWRMAQYEAGVRSDSLSDLLENSLKDVGIGVIGSRLWTEVSLKDGEVLWVRAYPGMSYPVIGEGVRAVLLEGYHSGTIGISEELKSFLEDAKSRGVPVYHAGLSSDGADYETIDEYKKMGIVTVEDMTPAVVYCVLWGMRG